MEGGVGGRGGVAAGVFCFCVVLGLWKRLRLWWGKREGWGLVVVGDEEGEIVKESMRRKKKRVVAKSM